MSERQRTLAALQSLRENAEARAGSELSRARAELARAEAELAGARAALGVHHTRAAAAAPTDPRALAHALQQQERHTHGQALKAKQLRRTLLRAERARAAAELRLREAQRALEKRHAERRVVERRQAAAAGEPGHQQETD